MIQKHIAYLRPYIYGHRLYSPLMRTLFLIRLVTLRVVNKYLTESEHSVISQ